LDPICHTLAGAALGATGLKRTARHGTAALLIGANLPDIDVLSYAWGPLAALEFRRGLTHGPLGLALLPLLLTAAIAAYHRLRFHRDPPGLRLDWRRLLLLSYLAILTHPLLDWCNTYGMRWLMPFSPRWWYGDALFIVDPWVWAILSAGILLSRTGQKTAPWWRRPATWSLCIFAAYAAGMAWISRLARETALETVAGLSAARPSRIMAAPVPVNPFRRSVVLEEAGRYRFGTFGLLPRPWFEMEEFYAEKNRDHPLAQLARETPEGKAFLSWARFPFYVIRSDRAVVHIVDARYTVDPEAPFGAIAIRLPAPTPPPGPPTAPGAQPSP
jgi:inner membrane protein